jgi:NAD(P)H-dependent FMN reductase/ketosteroid isomerase-like protein
MSEVLDVAVIVGSLRKASFTLKVARAMMEAAPADLRCRLVEIGDLSIYNQDLDEASPEPWTRFRREVAGADAVLFLTPEYNRSVPGCLKNALDIGSRPEGKSVWNGKPAGIVSVTPYKLGAFGANHALRQALVFLNIPAMQQPEAYIANAGELFDKQNRLKDEDIRKFVDKYMAAFARWAATIAGGASSEDFESFMKKREKAAAAYVNGDGAPIDALAAREGMATFFPPMGGSVSGAREVAKRYGGDVKSFSAGGTSRLEVLQSEASGGLAFWTGFQDAEVKFGDRKTKMRLRITELFRREKGQWKLVHRHADTAAEPAAKSKAS